MNRTRIGRGSSRIVIAVLVGVGIAAGLALAAPAATRTAARKSLEFRDVRADAERFIDYYSSIRLDESQARIKNEALGAIPAPCCSEYTMATCCCPCNLAKSAWGLSNYLIAKKGYSASDVKVTVQRWLGFVNPSGFTGDACFKGGCPRPFAKNGCGGMDATQVIVGDDVR